MATEHEIKFKASVDMSQANSQIQSAAQKFNINVVRQAVNMFGDQIERMTEAAGMTKFADAMKLATSSIENAIRGYNALGMAGGAAAAALTLLTQAFISSSRTIEKNQGLLSKIYNRRNDEKNKDEKADTVFQFLEGDENERNALYQLALDSAAKLQQDIDAANRAIDESKEKLKNGKLDKANETNEQLKIISHNEYVKNWQKDLNEINDFLKIFDEILNEENDEKARLAEEEQRLNDEIIAAKEQELKDLQENRLRSLNIFSQFDRSQDLKHLTDALNGGDPTARAAASDIINSELQKWTQIVEDFRTQLEDGVQIDNNALTEAISNLKAFQNLADFIGDGEDKKDAEKQAKTLEKTLNAVSNLAAIGGQEAAGVKAQTNDYIKNIEYYVRKISEEGMNSGVIL